MPKIRVCDVNDFFCMTGGGVRRYHLEKLRYLAKREDVEYHLLVPSDRAGIEVHGNTRIHHVPAVPVGSGYRMMLNAWRLRRVLRQIRPDVVEIGSPFHTPDWVRLAVRGLGCQIVGFWHANYPVTDVGRLLAKRIGKRAGEWGQRLAWWWARRTYGKFSATMAATRCMVDQLTSHGIEAVVHTPLGVDTQMFHPRHRDLQLRASWGAGPGDVVMAYAGRLSEEKNYRPLLEAYEVLRATTDLKPILVVAGDGPGRAEVEALAARWPEVHFLGYLDKPRDMARLLASADVVACLSPYETFGLAAVEAMASGAALLGSAKMSIGELLQTCRCGVALEETTAATVAEAWQDLLGPGRAQLLGARGHAECQQRYSWKATFGRIVGVYEEVLARAAERQRSAAITHQIGSEGLGGIAGLLAAHRLEDEAHGGDPSTATPVPAAKGQPRRAGKGT